MDKRASQRVGREQAIGANVDVAADRQKSASYRQVAVTESPLDNRVRGELGFQLAPERYSCEERCPTDFSRGKPSDRVASI